ncbi:MAG TPA: excinuclease ABC subunit UvrC [Patescibacteria group bacterium]
MTEHIKEKLRHLPHSPGVYHYFDSQQNLLYVGKAKDLFKRVHSYWNKQHQSPWTQLLVEEIDDIKIIEVKTELEALMLENSLIKSLRPKYNIQLRDDKTFPFLRVSREDFPTFGITRKVKEDGARYFGPYLSASYLRSMLKLLQSLYGIKTVSEKSYESRSSVPNQIGLGARNLENREAYNQNVKEAIRFLSSPQPEMEREIKQAMDTAAHNEEYERAAILRDRLGAVQQLRQNQSLFSPKGLSTDYIGWTQAGKLITVYVLMEREGKILDKRDFVFEFPSPLTPNELTDEILDYLYIQGLAIPQEIIVSYEPSDKDALETYLREQTGRRVTILVPQKGDKKKRLATAQENAAYQLKLELLKKSRRHNGLADLAKIIGLGSIPRRIEAFDISNLGSTHIVGASIVFIDGQPAKGEYRKYKIETPEGQNDFASMRELVFRRMHNKNRPTPDLLLIDGGKGQLSAAGEALQLAKADVPFISLAKKEELIFTPGSSDPIVLNQNSDALLLLTSIRDEVHRFVITFHRQRRSKSLLK